MLKLASFFCKKNSTAIILLLCIFIFSSICNVTFSQTYICPVIGYDFQKVSSDAVNFLDLKHKGFKFASPMVGIKFKQRLFKQFYFNYYGDFTHKHVRGSVRANIFSNDLFLHCNNFKNQILDGCYIV